VSAAASTHRGALAAIAAACLALLLGACARPEAAAGAPAALLFTGGYVVDPAAEGAPRRADVLVVGGRIAAVGTAVRAPANARRVDVGGRYLVPGLWDMHAHVAAIGATGDALEDYVRHGVLGIRDMGGRADEVLALRSAVAENRLLGPTMVVAGPTLNGAASADFHRAVRTAEEARAAVQALRAEGVDFIKIHRQTSREAFFAIRDQARAEGLPLSGHVPLAIGWIEAAEAGMRTVEHVQGIVESEIREGVEPVRATFEAIERLEGARGDAIFAALARGGTAWTPTLIYYENSWLSDSPERRALKERAYGRMRPLVLRAARAGVPILAGTDLMERRGQGLLDELSRLVAAGLTPREALAAATTSPRAVAGRGPGAIRVGEEASFIVLRGNPLERIENVAALSLVLLRGRLIEAGALRP
jgi:imidazolonepropionase-like amidohydrolase